MKLKKNLKKNIRLNNICYFWSEQFFKQGSLKKDFLKIGMGYRVIGGTKFYERAEIKDSIAFLRIVNHQPK